ncbi:MAG: glycosyltransferase family 39 protein, partial [Planctomycetota bacterium]|nr:glycosyltransferase family 39 protein [Planctomycetota bacterium]
MDSLKTSTGRGSTRQEWIYLLVAILLGLMVRLLAVVALGERFHEDPDAYQRLAKQWTETSSFALIPKELNLEGGQGSDESQAYPTESRAYPTESRAYPTESRAYPTAFRPPLYPLVLSCLQNIGFSPSASVITLHLILGLLTCGGTYWLGRNWLNRPLSLLASALVAADPILVFQSVQVMTETMATFLALMILLLWVFSVKT